MEEINDQDELEEIRQIRKKMLKAKKVEEQPAVLPQKESKDKKVASVKEEKFEKNENHNNALDKKLTISLSAGGALKFLGVLLIISGVFFLGRLSSDISLPFSGGQPSAAATTVQEDTGANVVVQPETQETAEVDAGTIDQQETQAEVDNGAETTVATTESTGETTSEEAETVETAPVDEEPKEEPLITDYNNVKIDLVNVYKEWHDTWGKIIGIEYKIVNGEAGTVKLDHLVMMVEGYDNDRIKEMLLSGATREIRSGQVAAGDSAVPDGFSYAEATAGDLSSVTITLLLYDGADKLVSSLHKEVDLG